MARSPKRAARRNSNDGSLGNGMERGSLREEAKPFARAMLESPTRRSGPGVPSENTCLFGEFGPYSRRMAMLCRSSAVLREGKKQDR